MIYIIARAHEVTLANDTHDILRQRLRLADAEAMPK
jgi:hypothetical protein